jgi:hypothetical protein
MTIDPTTLAEAFRVAIRVLWIWHFVLELLLGY